MPPKSGRRSRGVLAASGRATKTRPQHLSSPGAPKARHDDSPERVESGAPKARHDDSPERVESGAPKARHDDSPERVESGAPKARQGISPGQGPKRSEGPPPRVPGLPNPSAESAREHAHTHSDTTERVASHRLYFAWAPRLSPLLGFSSAPLRETLSRPRRDDPGLPPPAPCAGPRSVRLHPVLLQPIAQRTRRQPQQLRRTLLRIPALLQRLLDQRPLQLRDRPLQINALRRQRRRDRSG